MNARNFSVLLALLFLCACTSKAKMPESAPMAVQGERHPLTVALHIPEELKKPTEQVTSPFDSLAIDVGPQLARDLADGLPQVFEGVVEAPSPTVPEGAAAVIVPTIEEYENIIPFPAYEPHYCKVVVKLTCLDAGGETFFVQTTTGEAQTGGNLFSGFQSQTLAAEAAQLAVRDAARQALEGLAEAEEFDALAAAVPTQ